MREDHVGGGKPSVGLDALKGTEQLVPGEPQGKASAGSSQEGLAYME